MAKKKKTARRAAKAPSKPKRQRTHRPYPAVPFKEAQRIATAILKYASGEKVRRLTLLEQMDRAPTSDPTKKLITNSGKYGITIGSYVAEWLELTPEGRLSSDPAGPRNQRLKAQFDLAIAGIAPFNHLYEEYVGKRLPVHNVMVDSLQAGGIQVPDTKECIDIFVVNVKEIGLLRTIAGSETLISIEQAVDESPTEEGGAPRPDADDTGAEPTPVTTRATDWKNACFYITPIGSDDSEARKHSDLFMKSLIEPAMDELKLKVVRADQIGNAGMITSNILEHIKRCRLVIADLSMLNPNVFYEMALRHACRLPIVQVIRKCDQLPFDVNQVNTVVIDTSDIYTLVPRIETHRSEIATLARRALDDPEHVGNPITVFFPAFWK